MKSKTKELVVCKNFRLIKKLGTGAFGEIYLAQNRTNTQQRYAAKLQQTSTKYPQLYYEAKLYKYLSSFGTVPGIPKVHAVTTQGQYNVMLMDLLGTSLEDLFVEQGKKLSLRTVLQVGEQLVQRIEAIHQKHILHRDIKPDNFLMGVGKNAHIVYVVDFGLAKKYIHQNKHIPYKQGKQLTGTARYASINTHMGIEQSRRDDIESIGYVLMYLLRGILPWQNMQAKDTKTKYRMIMEKKISTPAQFLCKGFPSELAQFINYAKALKFEEKPDYKYLKGLLATARKTNHIEMDGRYDWNLTTHKQNLQLNPIHEEKQERVAVSKEERHEHVKNKKEEAINQALNNFQLNGGGLKPKQQSSMGTRKQSLKDGEKHYSKGHITNKTQSNILKSVGLETLGTNKIAMPKISVIKK